VTFLLFTKERRLLKKKSEEHQNSRENQKLMEWKRVCPFHTKQQNCRIVFEIGRRRHAKTTLVITLVFIFPWRMSSFKGTTLYFSCNHFLLEHHAFLEQIGLFMGENRDQSSNSILKFCVNKYQTQS
jgi:hypothetical protein